MRNVVDPENSENHPLTQPYRPNTLFETVWLALLNFNVQLQTGNDRAYRTAFQNFEQIRDAHEQGE